MPGGVSTPMQCIELLQIQCVHSFTAAHDLISNVYLDLFHFHRTVLFVAHPLVRALSSPCPDPFEPEAGRVY